MTTKHSDSTSDSTIMRPRNVTELRDDLLQLYAGIRSGAVDLTRAKEASSAAGKIIKSAAVQLEYQTARKETPSIPFLK